MEKRKSRQVDLEASRPVFFLLGLVFVLSLCYVAMEYRSVPMEWEPDARALDEAASELALRPKPLDKSWVAAPLPGAKPVPGAGRKSVVTLVPHGSAVPAVATRLKLVDTAVNRVALLPDRASLSPGSEEAAVAEAKVSGSTSAQAGSEGVADERLTQLPEFPGGWSALTHWLTKNLRYPPQAQSAKIEGRVVVSFIVGVDGKLSDVKVAKSVHPLLDREALRVARMMPPWKPGTEGGKPCRSMVVVPVVFKL